MSRQSKRDEYFERQWQEIQDNPTINSEKKSRLLHELEYEVYGDPEEEAREAAERDGYAKYY